MSATVLRRIVVDDTDPAIQYGPSGWFVADPAKLNTMGNFGPVYNTTSHGTSTAGSTLSFPFNGTSLSVMGTIALTTDANNVTDPTWDCFIDEIKIEKPNPTFQYAENNWLLCDQSPIASGSHVLTIMVQSKGQPFYLDSILYTPLPDAARESAVLEYTNVDPAVSFGSGWRQWGAQNITQTTGAQVALNFHGTSVSLFGYVPTELPHDSTTGSYTIDGGAPVNFALEGLAAQSATQYNALMFATDTLTPATHNLVVAYGGDASKTPLVVSTFYVTDTSVPSSGTSTSSSPNASSSADLSTTPVTRTTSTPIGPIIGGTVGCVAILAIIVGLVFWCRRRRRRNAERVHRTSANPFTMSEAETVPASVRSAPYMYAAVPADTYQYPYAQPETPGVPSPAAAGSTYPYMYPTASPRPTTTGTSSGGRTHAQNPSGSYSGSSHDVSARTDDVVAGPSAPLGSDGSRRSRKYERELQASTSTVLSVPVIAAEAPLTPLRGNQQRPRVVRHHQDSGVRLNSTPSLTSEPEIVDVPPGYSRN